jgi:hypothetical protein
MLTVDFQRILESAAGFAGLDRDFLDAEEFADLRNYAHHRLRYAWGFREWDDLERTEERIFCNVEWTTTATYLKGVVVFHRADGFYYVAVRNVAIAGIEPGSDLTRWGQIAESYDDVLDYDAATTYAPGDRARDPNTGTVYQSAFTQTGIDFSDLTGWGALPLFDRYVAYEQTSETALGDILGVYETDPKRFANARRVDFNTSENGVQVWEDLPFVWINYRLRIPELKGDAWDATATYAVGAQIYYVTATTRGNFYNCVSAAGVAESPATHASKWALVEIPRILQGFIENGMAADYCAEDRPQKAARHEAMAGELLAVEALKHDHQNERSLDVRTRPALI